MRHGKKHNHLSRTASHRRALLSNMANSLILSKRITTTLAKAKALRKYVEPIITSSKKNTLHSRRVVFAQLESKPAVKELFGDVAEKVATRPGGYTRIIKMGTRLGDNSEMAMIELVDYNELLLSEVKSEKSTKRKRRSKKKKTTVEASADNTPETAAETSPKEDVEDVKAENSESEVADKVEDKEVKADAQEQVMVEEVQIEEEIVPTPTDDASEEDVPKDEATPEDGEDDKKDKD